MGPLLLLLASCTGSPNAFDPQAIHNEMAAQQLAWNTGDIKAFMAAYSDSICFMNIKGTTCGKELVTSNYQRSYPDKAAMGMLRFGVKEVLPVGNTNAWVTGTWALDRKTDTLTGGFSLLWTQENDQWRIIRDHTY